MTIANIYLQPPAKGQPDHSADALKYAQASTAADPNFASGWYALGVAYADQKKKDQANDAFKKAFALFKAQNNQDGMKAVNDAFHALNGSDLAGEDFRKHDDSGNRAPGAQ